MRRRSQRLALALCALALLATVQPSAFPVTHAALPGDATFAAAFVAMPPTLTPAPSPTATPTPTSTAIPLATLAGRVWFDANKDGLQDHNETGFSGLMVRLYTCAGQEETHTTTSPDGLYAFACLEAGSYSLRFMVPAGHVVTQADQGEDDSLDSDANAETARIDCLPVQAGEQQLDWDVGLCSALSITKSRPDGDVYDGRAFTYDIQVTNNSDLLLPQLTIKDMLPGGIAASSVEVSPGGHFDGRHEATWTLPALGPREVVSVWLRCATGESAVSTYLHNVAMARSAEAPDISAIDVAFVHPARATATPVATPTGSITSSLIVAKLVDKAEAEVGTTLQYTIVVMNDMLGGRDPGTVVRLLDPLPTELEILPGSVSAGLQYEAAGRTLHWEGSIARGGSVQLQFAAVLAPSAAQYRSVSNNVSVSDAFGQVTWASAHTQVLHLEATPTPTGRAADLCIWLPMLFRAAQR